MKAAVKAFLRKAGYRIEGVRYTPRQLFDPAARRRLEFDDVVCRHMFDHGQSCVFIQVGAYDGVSTDPLCKFIARCGWRGVMLEPQPGPAEHLRALYGGTQGVEIVEAAIDGERGSRSLFTVEADDLPRWVGGMASFDKGHLLKHRDLVPGIAERVREIQVRCVTFADVLERLAEPKLDLLQIDAEGADGYLIELFPFERLRPAIVHWEVKNMTRLQREKALDRLCSYGYRIAPSGEEDMLAVLPVGAES